MPPALLHPAGRSKVLLQVAFMGEEGTGLGPTLEYYALLAAELQRKDLGMWLCDDDDLAERQLEERALDLGEGAKPPGTKRPDCAHACICTCRLLRAARGRPFPGAVPARLRRA